MVHGHLPDPSQGLGAIERTTFAPDLDTVSGIDADLDGLAEDLALVGSELAGRAVRVVLPTLRDLLLGLGEEGIGGGPGGSPERRRRGHQGVDRVGAHRAEVGHLQRSRRVGLVVELVERPLRTLGQRCALGPPLGDRRVDRGRRDPLGGGRRCRGRRSSGGRSLSGFGHRRRRRRRGGGRLLGRLTPAAGGESEDGKDHEDSEAAKHL